MFSLEKKRKMSRKPIVLSLFLLFLMAFAGEDTYQLVMLGDLHYDSVDCHEPSVLDNMTEKQKRVMKRDLNNWRDGGYSQKMLELVGKAAEELHSPFVIQIGDFCNGNAGSEKMAEKQMLECLTLCKKYIKTPFIAVKGNHDVEGIGGSSAFDKILPTFWSRELGLNPPVTQTSFAYRQGPDVFIFLDDIEMSLQKKTMVDGVEKVTFPNWELFQALLNDNQDVRYTFIVCHFPIIPLHGGHGFPFEAPQFKKQRMALLNLLCERNAIILCGHIHDNNYLEYANDKGTISQVATISLFYNSVSPKMEKLESGGVQKYMSRKIVQDVVKRNAYKAECLNFYMQGLKRFVTLLGSGYSIVRISPDGVVVDFRSIEDQEYCASIKMR
jgi:predicted phosphodiesterase